MSPKFLFPTITCLLTSNGRPFLHDALRSVTSQTRTDLQILVVDSGNALRKGSSFDKSVFQATYNEFKDHHLIDWHFTGEREDFVKTGCPVGRVLNEIFNQNLIKGEYFCCFYDDDLYHPHFMEKMAGFLDINSDYNSVRCTERLINVDANGHLINERGTLKADKLLLEKDVFDCQVDGGQIMMRTDSIMVHEDFYDKENDRLFLMPEDPQECGHSDGIFYERIKPYITPCGYIDEALITHRFSPHSTYTH